ncbi:hypothetical protein HanPSC8_Chr11g0467761 [Helianthus annuus]|nr:hypothetical protein HanPSC8_Chr11g0467761 [Helianthus annuus]
MIVRFKKSVQNYQLLVLQDHSKDDVTNALLPIKRPDRGTLAMRSVKLLVNHFPVKFDPSNTILRYDIDIKHAVEQEASSSTRALKKSIPKSSYDRSKRNYVLNIPIGFRYSRLVMTVKRIFSVQSYCKRSLQCSSRRSVLTCAPSSSGTS